MAVDVDTVLDGAIGGRYQSAAAAVVLTLAASLGAYGLPSGDAAAVMNRWATAVCAILAAVLTCISVRRWQQARRSASFRWHDQLAVVTGASSGLGAAVARAMLTRGCRVACVDVAECEWLAAKGKAEKQRGRAWRCDVSQADAVQAMAEAVRSHFGGDDPTIVVSNAGVMIGKPLLLLEAGEMERAMAVNYMATYHCMRAFLPAMLGKHADASAAPQRRGYFCVTASVMSYVGISQLSEYVASKHALVGLVDSIRRELDSVHHCKHVSLVMLILGQMRTPLFARAKMSRVGQFLMPLQDPNTVAEDLIRTIERQRSPVAYVYRPYLARLAPILPALPFWLSNAIQRSSGADDALEPANRILE